MSVEIASAQDRAWFARNPSRRVRLRSRIAGEFDPSPAGGDDPAASIQAREIAAHDVKMRARCLKAYTISACMGDMPGRIRQPVWLEVIPKSRLDRMGDAQILKRLSPQERAGIEPFLTNGSKQ